MIILILYFRFILILSMVLFFLWIIRGSSGGLRIFSKKGRIGFFFLEEFVYVYIVD